MQILKASRKLLNVTKYGLPDEPTFIDSIAADADGVVFLASYAAQNHGAR